MNKEEATLEESETPIKLLEFYQTKLESFDKERSIWVEKFEDSRVTQEKQHSLEWEVKKKHDEMTELNNQLNQANFLLYEERNQNLIYKRKWEQAKIKDL